MTQPWLTIATPVQPSKPERMVRLAKTLELAAGYADDPKGLIWRLFPNEGPHHTLAGKQCEAIRTCTTPWLLILSDDVTCQTPEWDRLFWEASVDPGAMVLYGKSGLFDKALSATACLRTSFAQAILPLLEPYTHYRIDDAWHHIAHCMQGLRYLPTVELMWEEALSGKPYLVNAELYAKDDAIFQAQVQDRETLASQLRSTALLRCV